MSDQIPSLIEEIVKADALEDNAELINTIASTDSESLALLLESLPVEQRVNSWEQIPSHKKLDVLVDMRADPRSPLIDATPIDKWENIFQDVDSEQLLEICDSLPNNLVDIAVSAMGKQQRQFFQDASQFKDNQIGHWLNHDVLVLPLNAKVSDALRLIRREVPESTECIFLVNRTGQFSSAVKFDRLFRAPEHIPLVDLSVEFISVIKAEQDAVQAARVVQNSGFISLPVLDDTNKLLGRVDIVTACELVNEDYERQVMSSAGMDENEDLFSSVRKSAKKRAIWLGINLVTAFLASWFIGLFEATLQEVVALAVLMPVVASMGGIAGSQTLTLIVRGLALGQVTDSNRKALLEKELKVGLLNGVIWAIVVGAIAYLWFDSSLLGIVISIAILLNIAMAALTGVLLPIVLNKLKIDPALSGSVILTTVTDIVGFVAFLGLGSLLLL
ncbi:magnesium transporter [Alteromonas sp. W364]|jgi:magnesium transporter|uniref:magnesium transporter n=1 Tax=Alteromonas sp. W364 TaxID=3075610 RepID=UPI00288401DD|nr:magnesium transporter [Alteromonas sp. W364]MDT0628196.1 magnesium transporter [Alteromonas sp. W364]